jgi:tRNA pseudouridine55 synthase
MNGVLNIDKPAGMTSHDVVCRVRKIVGIKRVGHAGTLDPDATGVLLVCLGHATRLSDLLASRGKQYEAVLRLGITTTTEDASGAILTQTDSSQITSQELLGVLPKFIGQVMQTPPMVSAVHHEGKRLYELARKGIIIDREPRQIEIESVDVTHFESSSGSSATLQVRCGKGTYIRTLCADIGAALGVGGHMATLRRTAVGQFEISSAIPLDALTPANVSSHITLSSEAVSFLPSIDLDENMKADILNGKQISVRASSAPGDLKRLTYRGELIALARSLRDGFLQPEKVFPLTVE